MPIFSPQELEALPILEKEGIVFSPQEYTEEEALNVAIFNLMPIKLDAELQLIRLMAKTELHINVFFFRTATYQSKNTNPEYLSQNYYVFDEIKYKNIDAFIITGAPVALKKNEEIQYWEEYVDIVKNIRVKKIPSYFVCWAGISILEHFYNIKKVILPQKLVGLYSHQHQQPSGLLKNIENPVTFPVSRYTGSNWEDIKRNPNLTCCLASQETGVALLEDAKLNWIFALSHPEYEADRISKEYLRDKTKGLNPPIPCGYFFDENTDYCPENTWENQGVQLFKNWLEIVLNRKVVI